MFPIFVISTCAALLTAAPSPKEAAVDGRASNAIPLWSLRLDTLPASADTAPPVITTEDITALTTFLQATREVSNTPAARQNSVPTPYPIAVGAVGGAEVQFQSAKFQAPNMQRLADSVPAVAQALSQVKLTPARYMQVHRALINASLTEQLDRLVNNATPKFTETTTALGKNVAFLRANTTAIPNLRTLGLELPQLQTNQQAQAPPATMPPPTAAAAGPAPALVPLALKGISVIDVTNGKTLANQTVVIVGKRIQSITPAAKAKIPKDAKVVDAKGKYVVPGFWEMHMHMDADAPRIYPIMIAHGVTGVRDMVQRFPGGSDSLVSWQRQVQAGTLIGPRVPGPSADLTYNMVLQTPADAKRIMDSLKAIHVAFVKFHDSAMRDPVLYYAILREAREHGIALVGHVPRAFSNVSASDSGQLTVEHIEENAQCWPNWPKLLGDSAAADARCKPMVDAYVKNGTYMMVGLNGHWLDDQYRPDKEVGLWQDEKRFLRMLHRLGMRKFITGTDWAPVFMGWDKRFLPGLSAVEDLVTMTIDADIPPLEALQAATLHPAETFKMTDSVGTVSAGKLADLVILDSNPLQNIRTVLQPYAVIANGRYFDRALLLAMDPEGTKPTQGLIPAREGNKTPTPAQ